MATRGVGGERSGCPSPALRVTLLAPTPVFRYDAALFIIRDGTAYSGEKESLLFGNRGFPEKTCQNDGDVPQCGLLRRNAFDVFADSAKLLALCVFAATAAFEVLAGGLMPTRVSQ